MTVQELKTAIKEKRTNKWFVQLTHLNVFAEGVTGSNRTIYFYVGDGLGYKTKSVANKVKSELKKTHKNDKQKDGLGDYYSIKIISGDQIVDAWTESWYQQSVVID